jgi:hypothetical protein
MIAPDGSDAWVPTNPRPDETLIRALARAHRWKRLLGEVSVGRGQGRPCDVNRLLRLTLLAPEIQEEILDGQQPKGMQLEELTRAMRVGGSSSARALLSTSRIISEVK